MLINSEPPRGVRALPKDADAPESVDERSVCGLRFQAIFLLFWMAIGVSARVVPLEPGVPVEGLLADGEDRTFEVVLPAGREWRLEVQSAGHNALARVAGPSGSELLEARTHFGLNWPSVWMWTNQTAGVHRITLRALAAGAPVRAYRVLIEEADGSPQRRAAERLMTEGARLYFQALKLDSTESETHQAMLEQAEENFQEASRQWPETGPPAGPLRAKMYLYAIAQALRKPARAIETLAEALPLASDREVRSMRALILDRLGLLHLQKGDFPRSRRSLQQAEALWQQQGQPFGERWTRITLCLQELREGFWDAAQRCYESLLPQVRQDGELLLAAELESSLGGVHANLGAGHQAIAAYERALAASQVIRDEALEAKIRNNLGALYRRLGEPEDAIVQYQEALAKFRRGKNAYWEARTLNNLGFAYYVLGELDRAGTSLRQSLDLRRAVGDRAGEMITLRNLGRVAAQKGDLNAAIDFSTQTLAAARETGDRRGESKALLMLGGILQAQGDLKTAEARLAQAFTLRSQLADQPGMAEVRQAQGELQLSMRNPEAAAANFAEALRIRRGIRHPSGEAEALFGLARVEQQRGRLEDAIPHLEQAISRVESLRTRITEPTHRASFLGARQDAYELLIDVLMELHREAPDRGHARAAMTVSERTRARTLIDLLEEPALEQDRAIPSELREGIRAARRRLALSVEQQLKAISSGAEDQAASAEAAVHQSLAELEAWRSKARRASPRFAAWSTFQALDGGQIQTLLDAETALLEISLGEERSFLWAVTAGAVHSFELPARNVIETLAHQVYEELTHLDLRSRRTSRAASRELARILLAPVLETLSSRRLVIVADGALHYVPFAALPVPQQKGETENDVPLLERFEVVSLPSASTLPLVRGLAASRSPAPKTLAIVADPVFDRSDRRLAVNGTNPVVQARASIEAVSSDRGALHLPRLPESRHEALAIASLLPSEESLVVLDFEASRDLLSDPRLRTYRMLHLATHGLVHPQNPELSGLMLSQVDRGGEHRNGFVSLHDLLSLELEADLAVLSGCRTALGKEVPGEGFVGLARGFLYAGVPRVVASLWQVEDEATAALMTHFYRGLLVDKKAPAAALRDAQLALREDPRWRDPFFWGAFVFQGDWQ